MKKILPVFSKFSNLSLWANGNTIEQKVEHSRKNKDSDWGGASDRVVYFEFESPLYYGCEDVQQAVEIWGLKH